MVKAKQSAAANSFFKEGRKHGKRFVGWFLRFVFYLFCISWCNFRSLWNWVYEPTPGLKCNLPSRGAEPNKTKVKVLLYGPAKTGTTSTIHFLTNFLERPYHSEDFYYHIWSTLADEYWGRRENGASIWAHHGLATPWYPAYKGHSFWSRASDPVDNLTSDTYVRNDAVKSGRLFEAIEKCHMDAMSFDGLETLFWDIFNASPESKVIFLDWRTYKEWKASRAQFRMERTMLMLGLHALNVPQHFLPWDTLPLVLGDYLTGGVTQLLRQGMSWHRFWDPLVLLFRQSCSERRFVQHWYSGLAWGPSNEADFDSFWELGRKHISKDRIFHLNPKTTKPAELCKLLNITNNPACDLPRIPKVYSALVYELTHWYSQLALVPWYFFIHWMSYRIFWGLLLVPVGSVTRLFSWMGLDFSTMVRQAKAGKKRKAA